ncbi:T9SS type A sorting domain-containing protein [Chryseobacterium sp. 8AT]|uniref:T9SS type A sorting domain-containing protein n=1 Tax=Chryseobacterium sp. 8AT TaxID=2653134 RepID=UPI0012F32EFE|nr:T9SS type A sorting domain-containing protein [Chryseobacterium sp. 8AT]VXC55557.1 Por secretion system C-terminal sorting domain-containing protein [Chryseobacterium sp. 8AT]
MNLKLQSKSRAIYAFLMALFSVWGLGQTPFVMSNGNYFENFDEIATWTNNFAAGTGAAPWKTVAINSSGSLGDGIRVTTSSTFSSGTSGGVQKGTGNLVFLSTGTNNSVAADLYLNFNSRNAGTLSFDAATVFNSNGNRDSVLKVFYSINNGSTFTELIGTGLPFTGRNNVANSSTVNVVLPVTLNNISTVVLRFYEYSTNSGGSSPAGSQPKISIDNLSVTSTSGSTPTIYTNTTTALDTFSENFGTVQTDVRSFVANAENLSANLTITAPANWEISLSPNSGFSTNAISLTPINNNVAQTNIYVRLATGTAIGTYSGNIALTSTGATAKNVAVAGSVIIGSPLGTAATNINSTSFNANWNSVPGVTGYFIDVYKVTPGTITEGFDNVPSAPSGWNFSGTTSYSGIGGVSSPSVKFDDSNDRIISPLYANAVSEIKFWIQGQATNTSNPSFILVEGFDGVNWVAIDNISPISTVATTYTYNSTSSILLPANLKQFRFTYTKGAGNVAFDDFSIVENQKIFVIGFQNKSVGNVQTTLVDNLTPATEYFYVVRSTNGTVTSANSNVIALTTASTTTWNGTTWSSGTPVSTVDAIFTGTYSTTSQPAFTAKNITIKNGGVLEITSGNTISGVNVTVEDGGNLIQKDGSTLSYSGTFKTLKNGTSELNKFAFWSSPVVGQNLTNIYTGTTATSITEYDTAADYYVNATSTISLFGKAYSIQTPVANAALVFEGTPNNGTQTFALATSGNGFNLIGNPYPSSLNLGTFYTANSARISSTFYFWDNKSTNVTLQNGASTTNYGYATFNAANGANPTWVPAPNGNGGTAVVPTGGVANIGQGFIVKTLNTSVDTSLTFNNEMRGATNGMFFNKNNPSTEGKFWLKLNSEYNTNNVFAVDYTSGASDSFDNYDSKAIAIGSDGFYTLADAQKLIIQGKASFDVDDVVPVGAKHFQNGNFTIALVQKEGLFNNGQAIYLHDKVTGTYADLQNGAYTFTANAGESTSRFEIVYKLNVLATTEVQKDSFEVYRDGQDFVVRNNKNIEKVEIFDTAGRKIQTINDNSKLIRVQIASKGVYILKALSEGKEYTKKLIK